MCRFDTENAHARTCHIEDESEQGENVGTLSKFY